MAAPGIEGCAAGAAQAAEAFVAAIHANYSGKEDDFLFPHFLFRATKISHVIRNFPRAGKLNFQSLTLASWEEEQIVGLTRLLTIALRVLTLSELQVRSGLSESEEALTGLYEGQPNRTTACPTAGRCLKAINRMELTATRVESGEDVQWHVTELPPLLKRIMKLLHLSPTLYTRLAKAAA